MGRKIIRKLDDQTFTADSQTTIDLPTNEVTAGYHLEMEGSLDIDAAITLRDEVPQGLVKALELIGDGRVIQRWSGKALAFFNYLMHRRMLNQEIPGTAIADPENFRMHWWLPWELERSGVPWLTYKDTSVFRSLQLRTTWGNTTDLFSAGTADLANGVTLRANVLEIMNARNLAAQFGGFRELVVTQLEDTVAAANTAHKIKLPRERQIRGLIVRVSDSATGFALSDTLLNNIKIVLKGTDVRYDQTYNAAHNVMQKEHRPSEDFETPGVDGSRFQGYVFVDFLQNGVNDLLDPRNTSQFDLEIDSDASAKYDVHALQVDGGAVGQAA